MLTLRLDHSHMLNCVLFVTLGCEGAMPKPCTVSVSDGVPGTSIGQSL